MAFATDGIAGMNSTRRTTTPEFRLGTTCRASDNLEYIYVKATETVTGTCTVNAGTFFLTDIAGNFTADAAFAANEYGWVKKTAQALV